MGNCCHKNSNPPKSEETNKNIKRVDPFKKSFSPSSSLQVEETVTSYQDIRKIYKFEQQIIGQGHYGTVRAARLIADPNPNSRFAVKTISKEKIRKEIHLLKRELEIHKTLDHPNIVKFIAVFQDQKFFHLVMEHLTGGELFERMVKQKQFPEKETKKIIKKIFQAVKYLHENGIVHRDLKPENFLFVNNDPNSDIKIIDFGLAQRLDNGATLSSLVGTTIYMAPEVLNGKYDFKIDVWSLGVVLYILLTGIPPFSGANNQQIFKQIRDNPINFELKEFQQISANAMDLLKSMLQKDPKKRCSIQEVLNHAWFKKEAHQESFQSGQTELVLNLMNNFRSRGRFKKEVLKIMVNMMDEKDIKELRNIFRKIDVNKTYRISVDDLRKAINKLGLQAADQRIEEMLKGFSLDNSQKAINYSDFLSNLISKKHYLSKEKLWAAFIQMDVDGTNQITFNNLKEYMARQGKKISDQELTDIFQESDIGDRNAITWEDFEKLMEIDDNMAEVKQRGSTLTINGGSPNQKRTSNSLLNQSSSSIGQLGMEINLFPKKIKTNSHNQFQEDEKSISVHILDNPNQGRKLSHHSVEEELQQSSPMMNKSGLKKYLEKNCDGTELDHHEHGYRKTLEHKCLTGAETDMQVSQLKNEEDFPVQQIEEHADVAVRV